MKNALGLFLTLGAVALCSGAYFLGQRPRSVAVPFDLEVASATLPESETLVSPPVTGLREAPSTVQAPVKAEVNEAVKLAPGPKDGWLRMAPAPEGEPYLPQMELDYKARVKSEMSDVAWPEIYSQMMDSTYSAVLEVRRQCREERLRGDYDIMSLDGVTGKWGEELLPIHYQGTHWKSFDVGNGTAEVVRLSPVTYTKLYEDQWRVEVLKELFAANHNRKDTDELRPSRTKSQPPESSTD